MIMIIIITTLQPEKMKNKRNEYIKRKREKKKIVMQMMIVVIIKTYRACHFFSTISFFCHIHIFSAYTVCICMMMMTCPFSFIHSFHTYSQFTFQVYIQIYLAIRYTRKKNRNFTNGTPKWMKERSRRKKKFVLHKYRKFMQMTIWWSSYHGFFFAYNILSFCLIATRIIFKKILYDQIIFLCSILVAWLLLLLLVVGCYGEIKEMGKKSNI